MSIQGACLTDENLGEVGVNTPVAPLVGVRQSVPGNRTAKAHVIEPRADRAQAGFDVAQTFAVAELRKRHTQELVQTRERMNIEVALIAGYASAELGVRKQVHQLRKDGAALVHVRIVDQIVRPAFKSISTAVTATL